jgi:hypothetical protein
MTLGSVKLKIMKPEVSVNHVVTLLVLEFVNLTNFVINQLETVFKRTALKIAIVKLTYVKMGCVPCVQMNCALREVNASVVFANFLVRVTQIVK